MTSFRGLRNGFGIPPEPDSPASWGGRDGSFGWFAYAAPSWWPRTEEGPRAPALLAWCARRCVQVYRWSGRETAVADAASRLGWQEAHNLSAVRDQLTFTPDFGEFGTVAGLCGRGHEAYVRLLHPIEAVDPDGSVEPIRWRDLPGAQLYEAAWRPDRFPDGGIDYNWADGQFLSMGRIPEPDESYLEQELVDELLQRGYQGEVIQAWWDGFGGSTLDKATDVRVHQPRRELIPFRTPTPQFVCLTYLEDEPPALVFPDDGAWVMATEIDLVSTCIGCSRALAQRLLSHEHLEVIEVSADDPLG